MANALASAITSSQTEITVQGSILSPSSPGVIQIESELIHYASCDMSNYYNCTRGYNSTSAVAHARNLAVIFISSDEPSGEGDLGGTLPITVSGGTGVLAGGSASISIVEADGSIDGYLSHLDWTNFNSKQDALGYTPVNQAGDTMSGILSMLADLHMNGQTITDPRLDGATFTSNANSENGAKLVGMPDPTDPQDYATKNYIDTRPVPPPGPTYGSTGDLQLADGSGSFDTDNNPGYINFTQIDGDGQATLLLRRNGVPLRIRLAGLSNAIEGWSNDNTTIRSYLQLGDNGTNPIALVDAIDGFSILINSSGISFNGPVKFFNSPVDMGTNPLTNMANPTNPQDAATKSYVDAIVPVTVAAFFSGQPTGTLSAAFNIITFPTQQYDTNSAYSAGTYTVPVTGYYRCNAAIYVNIAANTAAGEIIMSLFQNGIEIVQGLNRLGLVNAGATINQVTVDGTIFCTAGDTVTFQSFVNGVTSPTYNVGATNSWMNITKV